MIVVIGASGFIGTYLVDELVARGREVFVTGHDNLNVEYYAQRQIPFSKVDITRREDFDRLPKENIEAVVLLSGQLPANMAGYDPQRYIDVNITGTLNTLEYCRTNKAKKIIFTSSHSDVARHWGTARLITEEEIRAINFTGDHAVYIITKIAATDLVEHYHQEYGIQGITFRLPAVYGHGPHTEVYVNGKPAVPGFTVFMQKAMVGEPIEIWGDPGIGRDFVYVKDVVGAFLGAIDSEQAHGLYNIASGVVTSLEEEVRGIVEIFSPSDRRSMIRYCPEKSIAPGYAYVYDIRKTKRDLGYEVRYPFMEMLRDFKKEMEGHRFEHLRRREHKV